ncbi:PREDICTED: annexin-B12-like [Priapulus caudatus]|uniref:Annexin n=1 Tax=Priapulus caudatus TaxID=37621 RepID=A0ABM1EDM3_PRICU|nr:PREDICTED: annexin-B12-like [Priapulus caudatus]
MQAPKDRGTVKPYSPFNGQADAEVIRKAMKGFGTDEKAIIDVLAHRNNAQRQKITLDFKTMYGKDLIKELKSELSGKFEDVILALLMKPSDYDAMCIYNAIQGLGTDEGALIEILCTRSNKQMLEIKQAYKTKCGGNVVVWLAWRLDIDATLGELIMTYLQLALYEAGEKKWGTDESRFNAILAAQSFPQVQRVCDEYQKLTGHAMEKAISGEMSGDLKQGMMTIVKCVRNRSAYFAERLYTSMKGLGTNDRQLVRVVVTRCEVDMVQIKQEFQRNYGKTLESFINDDTSGDYKRVLVALVAGN